ncbi:hypothetical protein GCM10009839_90940 [Catenulispora yoronensis]|uniref:Glycosyl hydrolase family 95 catalytic domain-containing protein n=1 Tax=Catenulispora yoronensis TaxID=450799 RepID=A0ABN2VKX4_9ACTN
MSDHPVRRRLLAVAAALAFVPPLAVATGLGAQSAAAATVTTAWQNAAFHLDTAGVVSRSDVHLGHANTAAAQSLPLGNGSLGVAAWAANGFTAQLNRSDTMPYRLSPGQVQIPGLAAMTSAPDFTGTLDLYNGVLTESGGGMTLQSWVPAGKDELVVAVTGANPGTRLSATLNLWSGRSPATAASGAVASLAQTWVDNAQSGNSGRTFGAMAAITAGGQNVAASVVNGTQVQVAFNPNADGSFRVVVASPSWTGGDPTATANSVIGSDTTAATSSLLATQSSWWNSFWANSGVIEMNSADGVAQYMENLRTIYLYAEAASMHQGALPGSQAGVANMFAFDQDQQDWYPAGYWLWNLRGQIAANMSSGNFALNVPIFDMYLNDLPAIQSWTSAQMGGKPGACVPETMRFNGNGYYNGGNASQGASCATASSPGYNALTITSGAEIGLYIWEQYQATGNTSFLQKYYPVLKQTATFLLAEQSVGSDNFLHATANAHETQWAVTDPTTDLAADSALFSATANAATLLNTDSPLVSQLRTALGQIEPYARTDASSKTQLLNPQPTSAAAAANVDAQGTDVIANSYQPGATLHNGENIGLEPVWPFNLIGDNTVVNGDNLTALAQRTYTNRPNKTNPDWNFDAVQAARLGLAGEVAADLTTTTKNYQAFISGLANLFNGTAGDEPYIEQSSTVATAVDEALATQYDGTLRFAPAWPSGWDAAGTVYVQGGSKVDVQVEGGTLATAAIHAGTTGTLSVRNPWPGQQAEVVNGSSGAVVVGATTAGTLSVPVSAGSTYLVEQVSSPTTALPYAQVTGTKATAAKHLGSQQIGLDGAAPAYPNLAASFNNVGISADTNTAPGNFDAGGASFSQTALTNAHAGPGASVTASGVTFAFPNVAAGVNDNTVAQGQTITMSGTGTLGFLVSASYGPATGSGTVTYTDGSTQSYTITAPDWFSTTAPSGGSVAVSSAYQNRQGNTTYNGTGDIFAVPVALTAGKTLASVTLPPGGPLSASAAIHVFALATSGTGSGTPVISLRSHANNNYVSAANNGASPLIANRTSIGPSESFDEITNGDGSISLRSHANSDYVCADNAGANPLIANRTAIGPWESFDLIHNGDGSVSLRSHANNDYVTAENAGAAALIANRTAIGGWEEFDLIQD